MIPATPENTGGAGTGSLSAANTIPQPKPVNIDSIISFNCFLPLVGLSLILCKI